MHLAASRGKPISLYPHGRTRKHQSYNYSNAIRSRKFNRCVELRTQEQALAAEHRGGTYSSQKWPQPQPPHTRGTFHRRLQPLYTEKYKVSCSDFLPNTDPTQHSCNHNAFYSVLFTTTSLRHHFHSSPLPFLTTSQITNSLLHHPVW